MIRGDACGAVRKESGYTMPYVLIKPWTHGRLGWHTTFQDIDRLEGTGTLNARNEGMSYYDAPTSGVSLKYPVATGDTVLVKCAISYTSAENALANLDSELTHWELDQACADSRAEWNRIWGASK